MIVPANGSLPNIVLSPPSIGRVKRILQRGNFDVIHVHEPMTPAIGVAALATWRGPMVGTFHASGDLGWMKIATPVWGFLVDRIDRRIAVSEQARSPLLERWVGGEYTIVPNGVFVPRTPTRARARTASSSSAGTSRARGCTCCCARGRRFTGAPARGCGSSAPIRSPCDSC